MKIHLGIIAKIWWRVCAYYVYDHFILPYLFGAQNMIIFLKYLFMTLSLAELSHLTTNFDVFMDFCSKANMWIVNSDAVSMSGLESYAGVSLKA